MGGDLPQQHHDEVPFASGKLPFKLDVDRYLSLEAGGYLLCLVAVDGKRPVGYMILIAFPKMHHAGHWGVSTDSFYTLPEYRGQGVLTQLLDKAREECLAFGVSGLSFVTNANFPAAEDVAKAAGMVLSEKTYVLEF